MMRAVHLTACLAAVATVVFYAVMQSSPFLGISTDLLFIAATAGVSILGVSTVRKWKVASRLGTAHLGVLMTMVLYCIATVIWSSYDFEGVAAPFPSVADPIYLLGYLAAIVAVARFDWEFREGLTVGRILPGIAVSAALASASILTLLDPLFFSEQTLSAKVLAIAYPTFDTLLVLVVLVSVLTFRKGLMEVAWRWYFLGFILMAFADLGYSYGSLTGWYYSGHPIEILWVFGFIAIGLGFHSHTRALFESP
jgi:hypothetical protein